MRQIDSQSRSSLIIPFWLSLKYVWSAPANICFSLVTVSVRHRVYDTSSWGRNWLGEGQEVSYIPLFVVPLFNRFAAIYIYIYSG
jgi:hypothetical protein